MLPNRKTTGLPEARACCAEVIRGLASTIAGALLRSGLMNMFTTWTFSLFCLSDVMNSSSCSDDVVRVKPVRSGTVWSSAGHLPFQPAGTASPQKIFGCAFTAAVTRASAASAARQGRRVIGSAHGTSPTSHVYRIRSRIRPIGRLLLSATSTVIL